MFENCEVVTYIPDAPGKGGSKTGWPSHANPAWLDTYLAFNVSITQRRWKKDYAALASTSNGSAMSGVGWSNTNDDTAASYTYSVHPYVCYAAADASIPSATPIVEILSHDSIGGSGPSSETSSRIWSHMTSSGGGGQIGASLPALGTVPAEYLNIGKRCFYTLGGSGEGRVRFRTGVLSADVTDYPIGVPAPGAAPSLTIRLNASVRLPVFSAPSATFVSSPTNILVGVAGATAVVDAKVNGITGVNLNTGVAVALDGPTSTKTVSISQNGYIVSFASAGDLITALGGFRCEGLLFTLNGQQCIIAQQGNSPVADIAASNEIALAEPYLGPTVSGAIGWSITGSQCTFASGSLGAGWASSLPGFSYKSSGTATTTRFFPAFLTNISGWTTKPFSWTGTTGPTWAYSFYDPATGHTSNIGATSQGGDIGVSTSASMQISTADGLLSAPGTGYSTRFTHLLLSRTISNGGSVLFPIGSLQPFFSVGSIGQTRHNPRWRGIPNSIQASINATGTSAVWEDCYPNTELLQSGELIAPQFTNGPPTLVDNGVSTTLYPKFWEFWDGRIWMVGTQDPRAMHFSCDAVQCQFGRPEESYPDRNRLVLSAADGFVRGLELVGNMLVITTDRYAYYIAGNNETNYRLMRLSTDLYGVGEYQMAEFTGETEQTASIIVFLGRDNRVYFLQPGNEPVWISSPIQDQLDANILTLADYNLCRVQTTQIGGRKRVVVRTPLAAGQTYSLFIYDTASQTWTFNKAYQGSGVSVVPDSFVTIYGGVDVPLNEVYAYKGTLWAWLVNGNITTTPSTTSAYVILFPSTIDGKKTRKQIQFVRIYTAGSSTAFTAFVYVDEVATAIPLTFGAQEDTAYSLYALPASPVDGATATELIAFPASMAPEPSQPGPPLLGYRFKIQVSFPPDTTPSEMYAIQVGYTLAEEGGEVDP